MALTVPTIVHHEIGGVRVRYGYAVSGDQVSTNDYTSIIEIDARPFRELRIICETVLDNALKFGVYGSANENFARETTIHAELTSVATANAKLFVLSSGNGFHAAIGATAHASPVIPGAYVRVKVAAQGTGSQGTGRVSIYGYF